MVVIGLLPMFARTGSSRSRTDLLYTAPSTRCTNIFGGTYYKITQTHKRTSSCYLSIVLSCRCSLIPLSSRALGGPILDFVDFAVESPILLPHDSPRRRRDTTKRRRLCYLLYERRGDQCVVPKFERRLRQGRRCCLHKKLE